MYTAVWLALIAASVALAGRRRWTAATIDRCAAEVASAVSATHDDGGERAAVRDRGDASAPPLAPALEGVPLARVPRETVRTFIVVATASPAAPSHRAGAAPRDARGPPRA